MLLLNTQLYPRPIFSIHASGVIGQIEAPIINPHNLTIAAFYVQRGSSLEPEVLMIQDIREMNKQGYVINHEEEISPAKDLIRLEELIEINYQLIDKPVLTESKKKLGKVEAYVVNNEGMVIHNLHVHQPMLKSLMSSALVINRSMVVEVTNSKIIVNDAVVKEAIPAVQAVPTPS